MKLSLSNLRQPSLNNSEKESFEVALEDFSQDESFSSESGATYDDLDNTLNLMELESNILSCVPTNRKVEAQTIVSAISNELRGTQVDTASAIYQVCSAFVIQPDELDGLFDVIDEEKEFHQSIENCHEMLEKKLSNDQYTQFQQQQKINFSTIFKQLFKSSNFCSIPCS